MRAIIVGGSSGIGLAMANKLLKEGYEKIYILDKSECRLKDEKVKFIKCNLVNDNLDVLDNIKDINTLIITAGFGRISSFENISDIEIINSFKVNSISTIRIIKKYYNCLLDKEDFNCMVMGSIAGLVSSPLFSIYSATKASLCKFIESVNVELKMSGSNNRILNVSPGSIEGTSFNGNDTQLDILNNLIENIFEKMKNKETLYIPKYDQIYKSVLNRYYTNSDKFGIESYEYKLDSNRINNKSSIKVGYLSGTFDLFHIGHLNLLKRAKDYCDYLVVGVHKDASHKGKKAFIPFEERMEIVRNIKYVDKVIESKKEDIDVYKEIKYDYLFVGSDYKGSERFKRYEDYFKESEVKIIYMPYTIGTSSTELRRSIQLSFK